MRIPPPSPRLVVFTLWLLVFAASSQIMIISPILPQIGAQLGVAESMLGTLVSAYSIMVGIFAILSGPFSDAMGRRRMLLAGCGTMTVALLSHIAIDGYSTFLAARAFAGMAGGMLSGAAVSYVGDFFPPNRRGWAVGWVMSGAAAGQIAGIPLGVQLAEHFGIRAPFLGFAVLMAATFVLVLTRIPQPTDCRVAGKVTLGSGFRGYMSLLESPGVAWGATGFFLMYLGLSLFVVYLPVWLTAEYGATANHISILYAIGGLAHVMAGPFAGDLSDRIGRRVLVLISCVGLSIVMAFTTSAVTSLWIAFPFFFVVMALLAVRVSPFSALLIGLVEDDRRGSLMSLSVALGQVGIAAGSAAAGLLYAGRGYASNTYAGAIAVLAMGLVVWYLIPEREIHSPPLEPAEALPIAEGLE